MNAATPPPRSLDRDLVASYRTIVTRESRGDWDALRRRVGCAATLGARAFLEKDRSAWEVVQLAEWRLQRRGGARPTDVGDVAVLSELYRIEESTIALESPPPNLDAEAFCSFLAEQIKVHSSADGELASVMTRGGLSTEDWMYFGYQWLPTAIEFTRTIALSSLSVPRAQARLMYQNLYDEVGRGDWQRGHYVQLCRFLEPFGVRVDDEDALLDWSTPEALALANCELRMLWHREPGWGLGSMYLAERLVPSELGKVREAALQMQLGEARMAFLDEHVELDVQHGEDWLGIIRDLLVTPDDQRIAYNAALQRGRAQRAAWESAYDGWRHWKQTGAAPRVPARELGDAVAGADR